MSGIGKCAARDPRIRGMSPLSIALSTLVLAKIGLWIPMAQAAAPIVTIRPDLRHQMILGWSGMPWYPNVSAEVRDQILDEAVDDLGLTRLHWTVPSGNRSEGRSWEWTNDALPLDGESVPHASELFTLGGLHRGV